jgi:TonB family protein
MKNFEVIKTRPRISEKESAQMEAFDGLMDAYRASAGAKPNYWMIGRSLAFFLSTIAIVFYVLMRDSDSMEESPAPHQVVAPSLESEPDEVISAEKLAEISEKVATPDIQVQKTTTAKSPQAAAQHANPTTETPTVASGYVEAEPVGGFPALYGFFDNELKYPHDLLSEGIEGNVIVKFTINGEGKTDDVIIEKPLHPQLDSIAKMLIKNMPEWKPALLNGQPIPSNHRIPLFFQTNKNTEK